MNRLTALAGGIAIFAAGANAAASDGPHTSYPTRMTDNIEDVWKDVKPDAAGKWPEDFIMSIEPKEEKKETKKGKKKKDASK